MMLNQKTVIYIILSAILLYLYYKRGGIALFVAFVVVVAGTLFAGAGAREGLDGKKGGGNKECAKLGFTAPKIDKSKMKGSITNAMKNIQKVANKYWPFEDYFGEKPTKDNAKDIYSTIKNNVEFKSRSRKIEENKVSQENVYTFILLSVELYEAFKKDEKIDESITKIKDKLANGIKGGNEYLSLLNKNHAFLKKEYKTAGVDDKGVLKLSQYLVCLCSQWLSIWKQIQKANGSGGDDADADEGEGDDDDDEEDKPKKKKKKSTKKKSKKKDEDDEDEE